MKTLKLLFVYFTFSVSVSMGQKVGEIYLPPVSPETPAWFTVFYEKNFVQKISVHQLDEQVRAYEKEVKKRHEQPGAFQEVLTGEENEDAYILYYKRWRRYVDDFVQADGSIHMPEVSTEAVDPALQQQPRKHSKVAGSWKLVGPEETFWPNTTDPAPWQVNMYAVAIAPSNANILYGTAETGGIYKTSDKGLNWVSCTDHVNAGTFNAVAVHPTDPNTVYAGKNGQVYKSADGGNTWTVSNLSSGGINSIIVHPVNPSVVYAGAANGLFKTTDAGATWAVISGMNTTIYDLAFKPGNPSVVLALKKVGNFIEFWRSTDGGVTFSASISGWTGKGITESGGARMTVTKADANRIYAVLLQGGSSANKPFIFRSDNGGTSWDTTCTGIANSLTGNANLPLGMSNGQGYYDLAILANPANADELMVATTTCYKSVNGGIVFNRTGGYGGAFNIHPDIQCMAAAGADTWIGTDGGMNYSTDFFTATTNFFPRIKGLSGSPSWGFTQGWNEDIVGGGRYHNGNTALHENYPYGKALRLGGGESGTGYYLVGRERHMLFSDINPVVIPSVFPGTTTGFTFNKSQLPNEDGYGSDASEMEFLPYCHNHIFSGSDSTLWKSADGGLSWVSVHDFGQRVKKFEVCRSNPNVMYLATGSALYKTANGGTTWNTVALPSGCSINRLAISVAFDDANKIWICSPSNTSGNRVFKSVNGGSTWTNLTTTLINGKSYDDIVHQSGTDGGVYIIGNGGAVFYRNNSMTDWVDYSASLPKGFDPLRIRPFYRDGKLRAAGNRGFWEADFYEDSKPLAQPMVDKVSSMCARDTFYFDDFSALKHAGATWKWTVAPAPSYISSSSVRNPKVLFGAAGNYSVTLTVSNGAGSDTKTINDMVKVTGNSCAVDTVPGSALSLSNPGDYAVQSQAIGISSNNFTLSCWIKPKGIQAANAGILFSGSGGASGLNFRNNNQLGYHWNDAAASYNWGGGPVVPANEWSHVALVITPASTTVYLNGKASVHNTTNVAVNFNEEFQFGIDRGNTSRNFKGLMDEVCIYNKAMSQNEVRELMNLTRNNPNAGSLPAYDNALVSYYQFNESPALPAYDKVKLNHAHLSGGATKSVPSSAPVGGGVFQRMNLNSGGVKNFSLPGVSAEFPSSGTYPNGDVVVTRLNVPSDRPAASAVLPSKPVSYYVIRNYGSNASFSALQSLTFDKVQGTNGTMVNQPGHLKLYKRNANEDSLTWGNVIDSADVVTNAGGTGTVKFSTGLALTDFGQFSIGTKSGIVISVPVVNSTAAVNVYPNPSEGWVSFRFTGIAGLSKARITVSNVLGELITSAYLDDIRNNAVYHIHIPSPGIYMVTVAGEDGVYATQKLVIE